jgi:hypothetical protein
VTWGILQFVISAAALGYIWWQDGELRLQRTLAEHWGQCCVDRQKTIDRMLAPPSLVRPEQRAFVEDRRRIN